MAFSSMALAVGSGSIEVPNQLDLKQVTTSFRMTRVMRSITGKKDSYQIWLKANGKFYFSGLYLGSSASACTDRGGEVELSISDDRRLELLRLAALAYNENLSESKAKRSLKGPGEAGNVLFLELGEKSGQVGLRKNGPHTKNLRRELLAEVEKLFLNSDARTHVLSMQTSNQDGNTEDKDQSILVRLTNIGRMPNQLGLPTEAGEHFLFQGPSGRIPLHYASPPKDAKVALAPGKSYDVILRRPPDLDLKSGVVIYENISAIVQRDVQLPNRPMVRLCSQSLVKE